MHVYPGGIFHFTRAARDLSQFAQWRGPRLGLVRRLGPHSIRDRGASIVSGLSSGFSAYSHEIECVFAFVVVPENDSRACSIRAVRPTFAPRLLICLKFSIAGLPSRTIVARLRSLADNIIALTTAERSFIVP